MGLGALLYPDGRRGFPAQERERTSFTPLSFLGRHSLPIYLVHVPVILLALSLLVPGFAAHLFSLFLP